MSFLRCVVSAARGALGRVLTGPAFWPLCVAVALGLRLGWSLLNRDVLPVGDSWHYFWGAVSLLRGDGYLSPSGQPTAEYPVGYSFLLSLLFRSCGLSLVAVQIVQVVLSVAAVPIFSVVALRFGASRPAARLAAMGLAVFPEQILYPALLATETTLLFFILLCLALLPKHLPASVWRSVVAGISLVICCYIKLQFALIPFVVFVASRPFWRDRAFRTSALKHLALIYVLLILGVAPWTFRNWRVLGRPVIMSVNAEYGLFIGNNPRADGRDALDNQNLAELAGDSSIGAYALRYMVSHPGRVISLWPRKLYQLYWDSAGTALDWLTISKAPLSLGAQDMARVLAGIASERDRSELRSYVEPDRQRGGFRVRDGLTLEERVQYGVLVLRSFTYDYPTPRGYIRIRLVQQALRHLVVVGFLCFLVIALISHSWRSSLLSGPYAWVGLWMVIYMTGIYVLTLGSHRYSFTMMPFMILYIAMSVASFIAPPGQTSE